MTGSGANAKRDALPAVRILVRNLENILEKPGHRRGPRAATQADPMPRAPLFVASFLVLALTGCGSTANPVAESDDAAVADTAANETSTSEDTTPAPDSAIDSALAMDSTVHSTTDSGTETAVDSAIDSTVDSTIDATTDTAMESAIDSTIDSMIDSAMDAPVDSSPADTADTALPTPTCTDGLKNGTESDIDCGGSCSACADGKVCAAADDCSSRVCSAAKTCSAATCSDGVKNGVETDTDCGGTCTTKCATGKKCKTGGDCASSLCGTGNKCVAPSCTDGAKNGSETDVDCGGSCSTKCSAGKSCLLSTDCSSGSCTANKCDAPVSCTDGVKNGTETDVDCGGGCAVKCANGKACSGDIDCSGGWCAASVCTAVPTLSFSATSPYATGGTTTGNVTVLDIDGDGKLDIAAGHEVSNDIALMIGNGTGGFVAEATRLPYSGETATLDANADGKTDLVVGRYAQITVLTNLGSKTFDAKSYGFSAGGTHAIAVGNLDGASGTDIVATPLYTGGTFAFLNDGTGLFSAASTVSSTEGGDGVAVANLDGAGRDEVIAASGPNVFVYKWSGTAWTVTTVTTDSCCLGQLRTADVNGDGKTDVLVSDGSYLRVLLGNGDGTLTIAGKFNWMAAGSNTLRLGDMDGDGRIDAVACSGNSDQPNISILRGKGDGTFATSVHFGSTTNACHGLDLGDFNADGKLDIAFALYYANSVGVMLNTTM
jgi:hypothetical protein